MSKKKKWNKCTLNIAHLATGFNTSNSSSIVFNLAKNKQYQRDFLTCRYKSLLTNLTFWTAEEGREWQLGDRTSDTKSYINSPDTKIMRDATWITVYWYIKTKLKWKKIITHIIKWYKICLITTYFKKIIGFL